jgi:hypothetical protein
MLSSWSSRTWAMIRASFMATRRSPNAPKRLPSSRQQPSRAAGCGPNISQPVRLLPGGQASSTLLATGPCHPMAARSQIALLGVEGLSVASATAPARFALSSDGHLVGPESSCPWPLPWLGLGLGAGLPLRTAVGCPRSRSSRRWQRRCRGSPPATLTTSRLPLHTSPQRTATRWSGHPGRRRSCSSGALRRPGRQEGRPSCSGMKLSVSVPDGLWEEARAVRPDLKPSGIVQAALEAWRSERSPAFRHDPPADVGEAFSHARNRLAAHARQDFERGYRAAVAVAPEIEWWVLEALATQHFSVRLWAENPRAGGACRTSWGGSGRHRAQSGEPHEPAASFGPGAPVGKRRRPGPEP